MKRALVVFACMALLVSCDNIFQSDGEVKIRIKNASEFDMDSVLVLYPKEEVLYGNVHSGQDTQYKTVSKAYRYAYIETKIDGKLSVLQPIDYVGESFLEPGSYTYVLRVNEPSESQDSGDLNFNLSLELRKD